MTVKTYSCQTYELRTHARRTNIDKDRWQSNKGRITVRVTWTVRVCMYVGGWEGWWGVIEINGVRSEGAIRTTEGSKKGEREEERQRWSA